MYTAKVNNKSLDNGILTITVDFTDGTTHLIDSCIPQNEDGFKYWVKSRLETLNSSTEIASKYADGEDVDLTDNVVTPSTPTQAELDKAEWFVDYGKWVRLKTTLIDTGIFTGNETALVALKNKVKDNFKPSYFADL